MVRLEHRNIYYDSNTKSYRVYIDRDKNRFSARVLTLEDAISLKNEVIEFYETHQRLPNRSELQIESRIVRKENKYGKNIIFHKQSGLFRFTMERDYTRFSAHHRDLSEIQLIRDKVIEFYRVHRRLPSHKEVGFERQRNRKFNGDEHKYITKKKFESHDLYVMKIVRSDAYFLAHFHDESEAMKIRDDVLKFYRTHKRLPSHEEVGYIPLRRRK